MIRVRFEKDGLGEKEYDALSQKITKMLDSADAQHYERCAKGLMGCAPMIVRCSRHQYDELVRRLKRGRAGKIKNLIDKIRYFGADVMPTHILKNPGITVETYVNLPDRDRKVIDTGTVFVKHRNEVLRIPAARLTPAQMRKVLATPSCEGGARLLPPEEQNPHRRPRRKPVYFAPGICSVDGDTVVVTCVSDTTTVRVRFTKDDVARLSQVMKRVKKRVAAD